MDDIVKRIRQQSYFGHEPYEAANEIEQLRQRVQELEKETKQLRDLQYELMRSGALVAIEKCKNATGQRRVIDMYVSANQIAEDLLNAMDSGA